MGHLFLFLTVCDDDDEVLLSLVQPVRSAEERSGWSEDMLWMEDNFSDNLDCKLVLLGKGSRDVIEFDEIGVETGVDVMVFASLRF